MKVIQLAGWLALGLLLSLAQLQLSGLPHRSAASGPLVRLMGPAAELGRSIQWIRFQRALLRGDQPQALELGEGALALDPSSTESWLLMTAHLGYLRASPAREPNLERRRRWLQAAMQLSERGLASAREPDQLHLQRGLMLLSKLDIDPEIDEQGAPGLLRRASVALRAAAALGNQDASELLLSLDEGG